MPVNQISALPDAPSRSNPSNFAAKADAFLGAFPTLRTEINAVVTQMNDYATLASASEGSGLTATSTTSLAIASSGSITLTIAAGKQFVAGQRVVIWNEAGNKGMAGRITSYSDTSLTVAVTDAIGSGTLASWSIFTIPTTMSLTSAPEGTEIFYPPSVSAVLELTATEERPGLIELATAAEVAAGTDTSRAITPAGFASLVPDLPAIPPALTLPFDSMAGLPGLVNFTRASSGTRLNAAAIIESEANNVPRFDFNGDGSPRGLLVEGASQNLTTYSNAFDIVKRLTLTGVSGTIAVGDTVTGGTGTGVVGYVEGGVLGLRSSSGTFSGTVTATSGGTGTYSAITDVHLHSNTTVTPNAVAGPDGVLSADKLCETSATGIHSWTGPVATITPGAACSAQIKVKAAERTVVKINLSNSSYANGAWALFDLSAGTVGGVTYIGTGSAGAASIKDVGNGWYLCTMTCVVDPSSSAVRASVTLCKDAAASYVGDSGYGVYLSQHQVEVGPSPTAYIETTYTTAPTRSADVASVALSDIDFNPIEGTIYCEFSVNPTSWNRYVLSLDNGAGRTERFDLYLTAGGYLGFRSVVLNSTVATLSISAIALYTKYKVAVSFKASDFRAVVNGGSVVAATAGAMPTGLTSMYLGMTRTGAPLLGCLGQVVYFPRALTTAQLQALTS